MLNAGRQMWKWSPKGVELMPLKEYKWTRKATMLEKKPKRKCVEQKWIEKKPKGKNGLKWKWREARKEDQCRIGPVCNEKWFLV